MQRIVHLPLYGAIEHGAAENLAWDLYQSESMTRLRDISLSSVPSRFAPHGVATSRFQHSVAVGFMARRLCDKRSSLREHRDLLQAAGLLHDVGSPPFSHVAEPFLYDLTGKTHEEQTERLLAPGGELAQILARFGVDAARVVEMVTGRDRELGPLIAGSIDLDNVSNTVDLLASLGFHDQLPYHPVRLAEAFRFRSGQVSLDASYLPDLLGWAEARRMLYGLLFSEPNLSAMTMLHRAIEYAYADGLIGEEFFAMGESEALLFLGRHAGEHTAALLDAEARWRHFPRLLERTSPQEDPRLVGLYGDWRARKDFCDRLADELSVPRHELTFYTGRDRGEKAIALPFMGRDAEPAAALFRGRKGAQRVAVFAHKRHGELRDSERLAATLDALISELPEPSGDSHAFF